MPVISRIGAAAARGFGLFKTAAAAAVDAYFNYVTLLLPGNGTNGAQNNTFLDSSSNAFTITRNGNTTQGTFSPFSQTGWGAYFDGSGDYLVTPSNAALSNTLLANDFTIETWLYLTAAPSGGAPIWTNSVSNSDGFSSSYVTSNLAIGTGKVGVNEFVSANNVLALNQWNHFACVRNGSTVYIYVNGTQVASGAATTYLNTSATKPMTFGQSYQSSPAAITGYFSNIRVVSSAVYTANFTPPTAPLTAITNTQLLTCQSNRFVDNSSNAFAITRNGDVSVQAFSPFAPTASYSASTNGGSGYFDGSGDYLTIADNAAFDFGSGEFTVEAFFYPTSTGDRVIVSTWSSPDTNSAWEIIYYAGTLYCQVASSSTVTTLTTSSYPLNQWNHIAMVRTGNTLSAYLNGTRFATAAYSSTINNGNNGPSIGARAGGSSFPYLGFLSGVRVIKGAGPYDATSSSLTVPTVPLTAITNTQLLTNFTNAGIYDATSKNDLETVGNAQISTTQSKFGGSSMYFDGAGDYLSARMTPDLVFGSGDMTIECWIYANTISGIDTIFDTRTSGSFGNESFLLQLNSGIPQVWAGSYSGASALIAGSSAISTSTWTHIAFTRASGTNRLFVNGSLVTSNTNSWTQTFVSTNPYYVGQTVGVDRPLDAYLDDLRITNGVARYTASFTAPTAAFPLQ